MCVCLVSNRGLRLMTRARRSWWLLQYCSHTENHELKKLLMYYWEVVRKYDARGELLPEMILVWYVIAAACAILFRP